MGGPSSLQDSAVAHARAMAERPTVAAGLIQPSFNSRSTPMAERPTVAASKESKESKGEEEMTRFAETTLLSAATETALLGAAAEAGAAAGAAVGAEARAEAGVGAEPMLLEPMGSDAAAGGEELSSF